jgi:hypothetical protein
MIANHKNCEVFTAYKLFRKTKTGLAPLFINKRQRLSIGEWYDAEDHRTNGYAHRPGWHCTFTPSAPHLSEKNRVWCKVKIEGYKVYERPFNQGGQWVLANRMMILEVL